MNRKQSKVALSSDDKATLATVVGKWETVRSFPGYERLVAQVDDGQLEATLVDTETPGFDGTYCEIWDTRPGFQIIFEGITWESGPDQPRLIYRGSAFDVEF